MKTTCRWLPDVPIRAISFPPKFQRLWLEFIPWIRQNPKDIF